MTVSGALWYNWPELGAWPLLIAFLPWGIRLVQRQMPFQPTPFDLVLVVFLLTAWVGVWVSYDREMSLGRYWLILDAILLYYALSAQPEENLWIVTGLLGFFGAVVGGYFLLTNDFIVQPAKFENLNQLGLWLMSVRPALPTHQLHPNVAGGITAMLSPFSVAVGLRAWRIRWLYTALLMAVSSGIMLFSLLLTTSRGAWIALAGGLGFWSLWGVSGLVAKASRRELRNMIYVSALVVIALVGVVVVFTYPGGVIALLDTLPGPANAGTRLELVQGVFDLAGDFIFTGGGLGAFPALYSQYIRVIPSFFIRHAHNLFLDVVIEQGLFGALALVVVLFGAGWKWVTRLAKNDGGVEDFSHLRWSTLACLLVLLIHGMVEDPLYGSRGVLLLLLPVGLILAVIRNQSHVQVARIPTEDHQHLRNSGTESRDRIVRNKYTKLGLIALAVIVTITLLFNFRRPVLGYWYANLGAVTMARVELLNWPTNEWDDGGNTEALQPAEDTFYRSLAIDHGNRIAHYHLGLIAMLKRDYATAIQHLELAYQIAPQHRGIRKNLGYSYVWVGEYQQADEMLAEIPEAESELGVYAWWWGMQGRGDLVQKAAQMANMLGEDVTP